jgi:hypothetical protein
VAIAALRANGGRGARFNYRSISTGAALPKRKIGLRKDFVKLLAFHNKFLGFVFKFAALFHLNNEHIIHWIN